MPPALLPLWFLADLSLTLLDLLEWQWTPPFWLLCTMTVVVATGPGEAEAEAADNDVEAMERWEASAEDLLIASSMEPPWVGPAT